MTEFLFNRERERQIFTTALDNIFPNKSQITVFYGVSGQGKSLFSRYLRNKVPDEKGQTYEEFLNQRGNNSNFHIAHVDFAISKFKEPINALIKLRADLERADPDYVRFYKFDLALLYYLRAEAPNLNIKDVYPQLLVNRGSWLLNFLDRVDYLLPTAANLALTLVKVVREFDSDEYSWLRQNGEPLIEELQSYDQQQIQLLLPQFLADDLREVTKASFIPNIVVILDTYEALTENRLTDVGISAGDGWIKILVKACPGVLFVTFGQNKLEWNNLFELPTEDSVTNNIEHHEIVGFSNTDAIGFLRRADVDDTSVLKKVISASQGLPFYLNLQAELYHALLEKGQQPSVNDFGGQHAEIIEAFLKPLGESEKSAVYALSQASQINQPVFALLWARFFPSTTFTFENLAYKSYLRTADVENMTYVMHPILRTHLTKYLSKNKSSHFTEINEVLFEYFDTQSTIAHPDEITGAKILALREAAHYKAILDPINFDMWLQPKAHVYDFGGFHNELLPIWRDTLQVIQKSCGRESWQYVTSLMTFTSNLSKAGYLEDSHILYSEVLSLLKEIDPDLQYRELRLIVFKNLASIDEKLGNTPGAVGMYKKIIAEIKKLGLDQEVQYAVVLNNLAGALMKTGNGENEIEELFQKAIEIDEAHVVSPEGKYWTENDSLSIYADHLNNYAAFLDIEKRYPESIPLYREAKSVYEHTIGKRHINYGLCLFNLAAALAHTENCLEADPLFEQALKIIEDAPGEKSEDKKNARAIWKELCP